MNKTLIGTALALSVVLLSGFTFLDNTPAKPDYDKMMASVVYIQVLDKNGEEKGHGSGVILDNGYIASAAHVFNEKDTTLQYRGSTKDGRKFDIKVVKQDNDRDLAITKSSIALTTSSKLSCKAVKLGDQIISMGNPTFLKFVTTFGQVATERTIGVEELDDTKKDYFAASLPVAPGMSGGPVFDLNGAVIGINEAILTAPVGEIPGPTPEDAKPISTFTGISIIVTGEALCDMMKNMAPNA